MAVLRLGYVHVRVTDMEDARNHYERTLGMKVMANGSEGMMHLKCWDEYDHHSVVLEEGGVGLVKMGFKVETPEDLSLYEDRARRFGVTVERMSKGDNLAVGDGVRIVLPSDHVLELYHDIEYVGTETGTLNPDPWPRDVQGAAVPRLDHALISCDDPALTERFFMDVLGFKASERLITDPSSAELIGSWLFSHQKAHDIAIIKGPQGKLHHFAFWLDTWENILKAGDLFAMDDVPVDVGPTRHGITRGTTIYFFDPSGNRNEVFCGGYQPCRDFPTITWTADQIGKGIFYIQRELNDRFTTVYT